ncbi:MAG: hypothetical protein K1X39_06405 [Thermoflexales bacterium]|nr:hypothetical protein [Thermoflexales bacterium]
MKLFRPTEETKFHIDQSWFEKSGLDFRIAVFKCLSAEQQERIGEPSAAQTYDYVNPATGEIERIDTVLRTVRQEGPGDPNFITPRAPVAESAFRVFLLNGNQPLSPTELSTRLNRKPSEILAHLGGRVVYNGIRPIY